MAASVLIAGGDPLYVINLKNQDDFSIYQVIVDRANEFRRQEMKNLATDIANKIKK